VEDVQRVDDLFIDMGEAAEYLRKYEERMMIHWLNTANPYSNTKTL
jgi:hypothetical protein